MASPARGDDGPRTPLRVVLVDDVADIRLLLRMTLEDDPRFEIVAEAADGREAVDEAAALNPDVMLLDLMMPVMNGLEAIPLISRLSPGTKVIAYSGSKKRSVTKRSRGERWRSSRRARHLVRSSTRS